MAKEDSQDSKEAVKAFNDLIKEVHEPGLCGLCGGCVSFCSADELGAIGFGDDGKPRYLDQDSCLECGICYLICPQIDVLDQEIAECYGWINPMGHVKKVVSVRSTDPDVLEVCTDGGAVTSILHCLIDKRIIDGAVVSKKTSHFSREPMIATSYEDILTAAGSRFSKASGVDELGRFSTYSPTMFAIKETKNMDLVKIAVVGTPCQVHTLRKMQDLSVVPSHVVKFVLGLFCSENFSFDVTKKEEVENTLGVKFEDIQKLNIKEDLIIFLKNGTKKSIPLKKMEIFSRSACRACSDFSNDYADISFGGLGSPEGWTTVVIRTDYGEAIYQETLRNGFIEELYESHEFSKEFSSSSIKLKIAQIAETKRNKGKKSRRGVFATF
jgi:coenzyme F420 hydrogenase subunit beta